jgi:hypothetical protein
VKKPATFRQNAVQYHFLSIKTTAISVVARPIKTIGQLSANPSLQSSKKLLP